MKALVVDVGRNAIRYGLVDEGNVLSGYKRPVPRSGFVAMVKDIARDLDLRLSEVILAIGAPGPFVGDEFHGLIMPKGSFSIEDLRHQLTPRLVVVHDVIAGALGAEIHLDKKFICGRRKTEGDNRVRNPRAFIQTGVGLGAAALLPMPEGGWLPISGEGGSTVIGPLDDDEERVFRYFKNEPGLFKWPTAQEILSTEAICKFAHAWGADTSGLAGRVIFKRAGDGDADCRRIMMVYAGFLGSFAGSVALMYRAYDGLTIGGYLPSMLNSEGQDRFLERFRNRGAATEQLLHIPIHFVNDEYNTLAGLASLVHSMKDSFVG